MQQPSPDTKWLLLDSGKGPADFNMAMDEAILESMPRLNRPVLRFYGWTEPAASFGYFQKYNEVAALTSLRPLVRRPTGGGIVPHENDWTYSVAFPTSHQWYSVSAIESYRRIHIWVQLAFALEQVNSQLAPEARKVGPGQCFVGFEKFDLLAESKKIAGAAQRRRRDGLLIQGSVQPLVQTLRREQWQHSMCAAGEKLYGMEWEKWTGDEALISRAKQLGELKYSQKHYNKRR